MDQVQFVQEDHIPLNFLQAVLHKIYLVTLEYFVLHDPYETEVIKTVTVTCNYGIRLWYFIRRNFEISC